MSLRIDHLNRKIAALSEEHTLVLIKGEGYFYFIDEQEDHVGESVMVAKLNDLNEAQWLEEAQDILESLAEPETGDEEGSEEDEEGSETGIAATLRKYRPGYTKTVNYTGNASLDNGDDVAELLRGLSPNETCAVADHLFNDLTGTHFERYKYLNPGQRRMNAGNRIRALIKRGEATVEDLAAAIKGDDLTFDEADV